MKTEKISKLIDNAEGIRREICEEFLKRIEELYSSLKDKKMVFGWQDVVLPYPNEDDYETEDGTCIRDYIHVSDLATAHCQSIKKLFSDDCSYTLNLGTGLGTSVKEIVDATEKVIGKKLKYSYAPRRAGDPAKLTANADMAQEVLGWKPQFVEIEDIISTVWNLEI